MKTACGKQVAVLQPEQAVDAYGRAVAVTDNFAFVATVATGGGKGSVHVFKNDGENNWMEHSTLMPEDLQENDWFGVSVSASGDKVLVGAPAYNRQDYAGSAYMFVYDSAADMWKPRNKA